MAQATDSITARLAERYVQPNPGTRHLARFDELRAVLRCDAMRQGGASDAPIEKEDPTLASIFFLHGEEHKRRRGAIIGTMSAGFDIMLAAQKDYLPMFQDPRLPRRAEWFPLFCDPAQDLAPGLEREFPVGFVGTLNPPLNPGRKPFLDAFRRAAPLVLRLTLKPGPVPAASPGLMPGVFCTRAYHQ